VAHELSLHKSALVGGCVGVEFETRLGPFACGEGLRHRRCTFGTGSEMVSADVCSWYSAGLRIEFNVCLRKDAILVRIGNRLKVHARFDGDGGVYVLQI
jgi:hypothetical protein